MKATVEIVTPKGTKVITKEHDDKDALIAWLLQLANNPSPMIGYLDDGSFAFTRG